MVNLCALLNAAKGLTYSLITTDSAQLRRMRRMYGIYPVTSLNYCPASGGDPETRRLQLPKHVSRMPLTFSGVVDGYIDGSAPAFACPAPSLLFLCYIPHTVRCVLLHCATDPRESREECQALCTRHD